MMLNTPEFQYPALSRQAKAKFLNYAQQVLEAQQQMITPKGKNILHYTLERKRRHQYMDHYPKGDRIDYDTGAQYFYHCHREDYDTTEHGHFHCFLRYNHIPTQIKPTPLPDWDKNMDSPMTHLVAIGMNCEGQPIRLFSVNRCVSYEVWYDAKHINQFIKQYKMTKTDNPYWQVLDSWVEGMIHLFSPQIAWLQQVRDLSIANHQKNRPNVNVYEETDIQELSSISINLAEQVQWLLQETPENKQAALTT